MLIRNGVALTLEDVDHDDDLERRSGARGRRKGQRRNTNTNTHSSVYVICQVCIAGKKSTTEAYIMRIHAEEKCFYVFYTLKLYDQAEQAAGST